MESVLPNKIQASAGERVFTGAALLAAGGAAFAVRYFDPVTAGFFPACPLYSMTGIYCPGCGMTRGFHALFHGDILSAIDYNAMLPVFAVIFGYFAVSAILLTARGRGLGVTFFRPWMGYSLFVILLVFGVLRNIPVYPFNALAP